MSKYYYDQKIILNILFNQFKKPGRLVDYDLLYFELKKKHSFSEKWLKKELLRMNNKGFITLVGDIDNEQMNIKFIKTGEAKEEENADR